MFKKTALAIAAGLVIVTSNAVADNVSAQSGIYIGAAGGWSFPENLSASDLDASSKSKKNYTGSAAIGYDYALNQNWLTGLELGFVYFGKTDYDNVVTPGNQVTYRDSGFQILLTGTYLMDNGFNMFAKAGAIDQTTDASNTTTSNDVTKWIPAAAVGIGYMPIQNLNIALQYERTFGANYHDAATNNTYITRPEAVNAVTLGLSYKFGM